MARRSRPTLHLRLSSRNERDGEIPLAELAKVAEQTQRVVSRLARGLIDDRGPGRLRQNVANATTLSLIGLRSGSTVLDIAGPEPALNTLATDDMPAELGEMALAVLVESLETLSDPECVLPVGVDDKAVQDIDGWLRSLRSYERISIDAEVKGGIVQVEIAPRTARAMLRNAETQPSLPYVSAHHQALTGRLYALNLRTGTFRIEDDAGHSIPLSVPEDLRSEAAQLVDKRVRAFGNASIDSRRRLLAFDVAALEQLQILGDQDAFFERRDLVVPPRAIADADLTEGIIPDLADDEIDDFVAALRME